MYVSILEPPFRFSYHMYVCTLFVVLKFPRLRVLEEMPVRLKNKERKKKEEKKKGRIGKKDETKRK